MKTFVVLEEIKGISKKSGNPYHMIKFADSATFANHTVAVDQNYIRESLGLHAGTKVNFTLDLNTDFRGTLPVITAVNVVK